MLSIDDRRRKHAGERAGDERTGWSTSLSDRDERAAWASMPAAIRNVSRRHGIEKKVPKEAKLEA